MVSPYLSSSILDKEGFDVDGEGKVGDGGGSRARKTNNIGYVLFYRNN